ncbi:MAG: serpin family protein [Sporichthyaceae bacterium]
MRRTRPTLIALLGALLVAGCGSGGGTDSPFDLVTANVGGRVDPKLSDRKDIDVAADASTAFAMDLYRRVAAESKGANLVLGPYSTWLALSMLAVGAKGKTAEELATVLHHPFSGERLLQALNALQGTIVHRTDDDDTVLRMDAQIFGRRGLEFVPAYLDAMAGHFGAPLASIDFADSERARMRINDWVKDRTEGKIPELLKPGLIDPSIVVVLVNAMYLDAPWEFAIDPKQTSPSEFTKADGSTVEVPFMYYDDHLPSFRGDGWSAVDLPYEGGGLSMTVVVPDRAYEFPAGGGEGREVPAKSVDRIAEDLDAAALEKLFSGLKGGGIHLRLPRFTFSTHRAMKADLKAMGAPTAVDRGDYTGITPGGFDLRFVEHEAFVQVDEYGTKAAAATAVGGGESHGPTIEANRPFLFLIREKATNTVLFVGRVMDPSAN